MASRRQAATKQRVLECQEHVSRPRVEPGHRAETGLRCLTTSRGGRSSGSEVQAPGHSTSLRRTTADCDVSRSSAAVLPKSRTATVPKVFQIGLCVVVEADLELFCNSCSAGFLGERL